MPELAQFQHEFAARLERPMPASAPMRVYRNTVMLGAIEALAANFPVCAMILGERAFEANALAFARRHPPEVPVLALYGRGFGDWIAGQPVASELPYLADVARCEELHSAALHSADAQAIEPLVLEALPPERLPGLKLRLHPAARFGWFETPAMPIWLAHQGDGFDAIAPEWRAGGALFTRPDTHASGCELGSLGHRLLAGIRLGETLGGAAQAASTLFPGADVGACFGMLVARGAFVVPSN
jgi:Putative DNA-binding domain